MSENGQRAQGVVRAMVQTLAASLIALALPVLDALDVDAGAVQAVIIALILGVYWWGLNWLQMSDLAAKVPIIGLLVAVAMGGRQAPTYVQVETIDT